MVQDPRVLAPWQQLSTPTRCLQARLSCHALGEGVGLQHSAHARPPTPSCLAPSFTPVLHSQFGFCTCLALDVLCFPFLAWEYPIPGAWSGSPDWSSTLPRKLCLFLSLGGTICSNHPNSSWVLAPRTSYSMALLEEGSKRMGVGHSFKFWCHHFLAWVGDYRTTLSFGFLQDKMKITWISLSLSLYPPPSPSFSLFQLGCEV